MNNIIENRNSGLQNVTSWVAMALVTIGAFFCTYYYVLSAPIQAIVWLAWFVSMILLGYTTTKGKQAYQFAVEAKVELLKVVWPTRQETIQTTIIVMVMVALAGFILWGVDSAMMWAIAKITHLG
ncbi:MAG: preprotein translocase subunit SecE [Legionella sp.]|nr:preprotein translocase subunit SecE [Legionella sp.]